MKLTPILFVLLTSGCAVAVDDGSSNDGDSGKAPPRGAEGGSMLGQPTDDSGSMDQPDGSVADTGGGSQSNCSAPFSGTLATFDFTGEPGNQASTAVKSTAPSVTAAAMTRSNVTAVTGLNSINASSWPTSMSVDPMRYYSFSITPPNGCSLDISSLAIDTKTSSTGPLQGAVATSADNFGMAAQFSTGSAMKVSMSVSGSTKSVEVRVYGYGASAMAGTFRIQNTLTVTGALN